MPANKRQKRNFPVNFPFSKKSRKNLESIPFPNLIFISVGLGLITILLIVFLQSFLPPEVPLYYGRPIPEKKLSTSISLIIPSLISLGITAINFTLSYIIRDNFIKRVLIASTFAAGLLSTITVLRIVFLIGSF